MRGLLQELGGTPRSLPLPVRPYVRKCLRFRDISSGNIMEPSHPHLTHKKLGKPRKGKEWAQKIPGVRLFTSCCSAGLWGFLSLPLG